MASLLNKSRKPKFELHLKIYDLNNVPLVSGVSLIKWHLPHSIHGEHRGKTRKCSIANHRVEYGYSKIVPVRIAIDRSNNLSPCSIEFEVLQEFESSGAVRDEKIVLGKVTLNLSEYVEESEAIQREARPGTADSRGHVRKRSSLSSTAALQDINPLSHGGDDAAAVEEGVVRRYLMQESKINSTLKIGILMVQVDGERSFVAPALKTAPVFGGIAGIMTGEQVEPPDDAGAALTPAAISSKSRDANASELQDMYRRALAASWACQPGEMPADECIEDIFGGGDGFRDSAAASPGKTAQNHHHNHKRNTSHVSLSNFGREDSSASGEDGLEMGATLRPQDVRLFQRQHHQRAHSGASDRSVGTVTRNNSGRDRGRDGHRRELSKDEQGGGSDIRSRSESLTSLATTMGSDRGREGFKRAREVDEFEVRDDLVAWALPEKVR